MEFFRKIYKLSNQYTTEITEDLCNLGFNSAIDNADFPKENFGEQWLKWKYEPILYADQAPQLRSLNPRVTDFINSTMVINIMGGSGASSSWNQRYKALFFIPLINNSFFMRTTSSTSETAIPFFPGMLNLNTDANPHYDEIWTYMGLQSNISNYSPYSYYLYSGNGIPNNLNYTYYSFITDRNQGFQLEGMDTPYKYNQGTEQEPNYQKFPPLETVSVSNGVCTLVKAPYFNEYIDGLYYIAVSPQDSVDGRFFSFGGRNFMGVGRNLVVELPNK